MADPSLKESSFIRSDSSQQEKRKIISNEKPQQGFFKEGKKTIPTKRPQLEFEEAKSAHHEQPLAKAQYSSKKEISPIKKMNESVEDVEDVDYDVVPRCGCDGNPPMVKRRSGPTAKYPNKDFWACVAGSNAGCGGFTWDAEKKTTYADGRPKFYFNVQKGDKESPTILFKTVCLNIDSLTNLILKVEAEQKVIRSENSLLLRKLDGIYGLLQRPESLKKKAKPTISSNEEAEFSEGTTTSSHMQ